MNIKIQSFLLICSLILFVSYFPPDSDIVSLLKIRDAVYSYKRLIEFKKSHCELLTGKLKRMENKFKESQKEISETKEVRSQLEHEKVEWEQELSNLRYAVLVLFHQILMSYYIHLLTCECAHT